MSGFKETREKYKSEKNENVEMDAWLHKKW